MKKKSYYGQGISKVEEKQLRSHLLCIMRSGTGLAVEFAEMIYMDQLEDGDFRVCIQEEMAPISEGDEYIFKKEKDAVDFFLKMRRKMKLGFDFEGTNPLQEFLDNVNVVNDKDGEVHIEGKVSEDVFEKLKEFYL